MIEPRNLSDRDASHRLIGTCLKRGYEALRSCSDSAQLDAQLLLAFALARPRAHLRAHPEARLDAESIARYESLLARRAQGEPLAYLTGEREFWSLTLSVTPDVLIPRPETELAVERCLALGPDAPCIVADLGTGSGAIALALAAERPEWQLYASDRSQAALKVARANAERHRLSNIKFLQGEWFESLGARQFDLIVSNPPYVAAGDACLVQLRYEPAIALSPGATGMEALEHLILQAPAHLLQGGWLVLEHGASQGPAVAQALVSAGYARVRCYADLAGHDRVTEAQWPSIKRSVSMVRFETSHGAFTVELFDKEAPLSAANFLQYVDDGFYDGTIFHRIVPGFVIQGGGLTADFDQKKTRPPVKNEATNGELNERGTLSMARTDEIHSATSQFFVNLTDNEFLDHKPGSYGYAVFGRVKEGIDVIDKIAKVKTGRRKHYTDAPMEDVVITSAKRIEAAK
jgi:release factor glutamine methyltransferase